MPKAGFCDQCQANVWLRDDGSCEHGHPAEAVADIYEAEPAVPPAVASDAPVHKKRRWWIVAIAMLAAIVVCGVLSAAVRPLLRQGTSIASEWRTRIAADYPGWKPVSFNVRSFTGEDGAETTYSFGLIPPGRDFAVGVVYVSTDGGEAVSQDEVLRPAGQFNYQGESLLDFIDQNYAAKGREVVAVDTNPAGSVIVQWVATKRFGPFSSHIGSFDQLAFDMVSKKWLVVHSPDMSD